MNPISLNLSNKESQLNNIVTRQQNNPHYDCSEYLEDAVNVLGPSCKQIVVLGWDNNGYAPVRIPYKITNSSLYNGYREHSYHVFGVYDGITIDLSENPNLRISFEKYRELILECNIGINISIEEYTTYDNSWMERVTDL